MCTFEKPWQHAIDSVRIHWSLCIESHESLHVRSDTILCRRSHVCSMNLAYIVQSQLFHVTDPPQSVSTVCFIQLWSGFPHDRQRDDQQKINSFFHSSVIASLPPGCTDVISKSRFLQIAYRLTKLCMLVRDIIVHKNERSSQHKLVGNDRQRVESIWCLMCHIGRTL